MGTKRTPRQDAKSNTAKDDEQNNTALRRRNHKKKHKKKNLIYVKTTYLDWERKKKKDADGWIAYIDAYSIRAYNIRAYDVSSYTW